MNNQVIVHISHTDINFDNRILKEMAALSNVENFYLHGVGVVENEAIAYKPNHGLNVDTVSLKSKKFTFFPRPLRYFLNYVEAFFKFLPILFKLKPAVIHCHDTLFLPIGFVAKLFLKSKLVYDAHELESQKNGQSKVLSKATFLIEKLCWPKVDFLITVAPAITRWYDKILGAKKSLVVLNSPEFDPLVFNTGNNNYLREYFNIPKDKKIFLYLGIIGKGRSIDLYLDVFNNINVDSHIVFVGYGEYVNNVKEYSKICSKIHYHPAVKHDEVVKIAKSADVGLCLIQNVSLSDFYCLPNKLFEYAFSGLYVLASDFPEMRRVVNQYCLGQTCDLKEEALTNSINIIEQFELASTSKDLTELSWGKQSQQLVDAYQTLLKN